MKYSVAISIFTMAIAAIAAPAAVGEPEALAQREALPEPVEVAEPVKLETRTKKGSKGGLISETCTNKGEAQVCCNGLGCLIQILGSGCRGGNYCCNTGASTGGLINLNLLNCASLP